MFPPHTHEFHRISEVYFMIQLFDIVQLTLLQVRPPSLDMRFLFLSLKLRQFGMNMCPPNAVHPDSVTTVQQNTQMGLQQIDINFRST